MFLFYFFFLVTRGSPRSTLTYTLFPSPTLFRSRQVPRRLADDRRPGQLGRRGLSSLPRTRRRRHHFRRLPHRPRRDRGLPAEASRRGHGGGGRRSEEHTSELQSLMRISSAVFCLKTKTKQQHRHK